MSAESAADKFAAFAVGAMVGVIAGVGGWLVGSRWGYGEVGAIVGFGVGDVAGLLVFRAIQRSK